MSEKELKNWIRFLEYIGDPDTRRTIGILLLVLGVSFGSAGLTLMVTGTN